jgi:hypothetical protein
VKIKIVLVKVEFYNGSNCLRIDVRSRGSFKGKSQEA